MVTEFNCPSNKLTSKFLLGSNKRHQREEEEKEDERSKHNRRRQQGSPPTSTNIVTSSVTSSQAQSSTESTFPAPAPAPALLLSTSSVSSDPAAAPASHPATEPSLNTIRDHAFFMEGWRLDRFQQICIRIQSAILSGREFVILNKSEIEEDEDAHAVDGASMEMFWLPDGAREIFIRINSSATLGGVFDDEHTRRSTIAPVEEGQLIIFIGDFSSFINDTVALLQQMLTQAHRSSLYTTEALEQIEALLVPDDEYDFDEVLPDYDEGTQISYSEAMALLRDVELIRHANETIQSSAAILQTPLEITGSQAATLASDSSISKEDKYQNQVFSAKNQLGFLTHEEARLLQYLHNFRAQNNAAEIVPVPTAESDSEVSDSEEEIESVPRVVSILRLHLNSLPDLSGNIAAPAGEMGLPPPVTETLLSNIIIINRIHNRLLHFLARPGAWANS